MEAGGKDWDLLLPYVLFAIGEVPQASTGFELLYGRRPRGLLDLAKEAWESQPSPHRTALEYVEQMRDRMASVWAVVRQHLQQSQQNQARVYNRSTQVRTFQTGDWVLVLIPSTDCKFLARWQGPYEVVERVTEVNYRDRQPEADTIIPCELVKKMAASPRAPECARTVPDYPGPRSRVPTGEMLSPHQTQSLRELVEQHRDVFSEAPACHNHHC